jgi:hypothetical protein
MRDRRGSYRQTESGKASGLGYPLRRPHQGATLPAGTSPLPGNLTVQYEDPATHTLL